MRKSPPKKAPVRRRPAKKKRSYLKPALLSVFLLFIGVVGYHYRDGLAYYFSFKSDKTIKREAEERRLAMVRNVQVLCRHEGKVIGFDVSEYQGKVDWEAVDSVEQLYPLKFVFIRATAGKDRIDGEFKRNWKQSGEEKLIRGAYHYYRPNENSLEQAENFIKTVKLKKGDLPPVLDIEKLPKNQSIDSLKVGLRRWLDRVEAHYKVRPIIYSGEKYYDEFLSEEFAEYTFWIANYNFFVEQIDDEWLFWQFTEKAVVPGIKGEVDINIYNGTPKMLQYLTIGN